MKIGIIGLGYVGTAMYDFFKDHYDVVFYDPGKKGSCSKEYINMQLGGRLCSNPHGRRW